MRVVVAPDESQDRAADPYRYIFSIEPTAWSPAVVVADRRLLSFSVTPNGSRRSLPCRSAELPRARTDAPRTETLRAGQRHREWIDLRMYCWGRALRALEQGAAVTVAYSWPRASRRDAWVAHPEGDVARATNNIVGEPFSFAAVPAPSDASPLRITVAPLDTARTSNARFSVRIASSGPPVRIYARPDLLRFHVRGPLGEVSCAVPRQRIIPIIDFYTLLRGNRSLSFTVDLEHFCPEGFPVQGIYEVTPTIDLVYDGAGYDLQTLTGTFTGVPGPMRVHSGAGYVDQTIEAP